MIHETLKKLGFSDKESEIYLTILQQGKIAPADVAKLTKINRSTVYDVAKELIKRGIISEDLGSSVRYFVAQPPKDLQYLAQREEESLKEKKGLISLAINELESLAQSTQYSVPKIQFFSEDEVENFLYRHTPIWDESMRNTDGIWWGFQDYTLVEHYLKWIQWYWTRNNPSRIETIQILSNTKQDKAVTQGAKLHPGRNIRYWNKAGDFTATVWVCGEYIIMMMTRQRPHYAVEIRDSVLAHNQRQVFKGIWEGLS